MEKKKCVRLLLPLKLDLSTVQPGGRQQRRIATLAGFVASLPKQGSCPGSHHQTEKKTAKEGDQVDQLWLVRFSRFDLRRERGGRGGSDDDGRRQRIDKELLQQDWHSGEEALKDGRLEEVIVEVVEDPASGEGHRGEEAQFGVPDGGLDFSGHARKGPFQLVEQAVKILLLLLRSTFMAHGVLQRQTEEVQSAEEFEFLFLMADTGHDKSIVIIDVIVVEF
ncbi:hypothetical protein TYRP_014756 [Tyrophagus putrescentiae]|nr:hypothetical protein TYRP_014756 [Tyrophagus putrescentiae]